MHKNPKASLVSKATYSGCGCLLFIICVGISHAWLLPLFLNNTNTSKQTEGKQFVASMNKGQQAYFAEKGAFATSVNALGIGIKTETTNYKYSVRATQQTVFNYGLSKQPQLKSYVGGVFVKRVKSNNAKDEITTESILCSAEKPGTMPPLPPTLQKGKLVCETGTTQVTK